MPDLEPSLPGTTRASDADRDRVLQVLATATADGRITVDEHSDLMTQALQARTIGELQVLTQDLATIEAPPAPSPVVATGEVSHRGFLAVFGAKTKKGAWHVPTEFKATAVFGAVELDFRDAVFEAAEVTCVANCFMGAVEITVPEWVRVVDDGTAIFGAREEAGPGGGEAKVTLHLKGLCLFGATEVRRKGPRRRSSKAIDEAAAAPFGHLDAEPASPELEDAPAPGLPKATPEGRGPLP